VDSDPPLIDVQHASRRFRVAVKGEGAGAGLRHFFARTYKDVVAVDDVSFTIRRGERVGFLGANGAGKTTTLKILSGLLLPTSGTVTVAGVQPFQKAPEFLRRIALVMGNKQQLLWDLPARETFRLNGALYGVDDATLRERIAELAAMLELVDLLDQPVRKLSLGERMKAELLASLLHAPEVLFLDEPTLGLDVNAQVAVRDFLRRYNERTGATILLTSHYMADITALCPRVLVIHEGRLVFDGDLKALAHRFAPQKELRLELDHDVTAADTAVVEGAAVPVAHAGTDGRVVRFTVAPHGLNAALQLLLDRLRPVDLSVTDPPIEDLIGRAIRGETGASPPSSSSSSSSSSASSRAGAP
jgi:ABC-2 type transport system ATP-binding protein